VAGPAVAAADVAAAQAAAVAAPGVAYVVDGADARVEAKSLDGGPVGETYVLGPDHRVTAAGASAISYNLDGHRTMDARHFYDLDALNRVSRVRDRATNATVVDLHYDALSRVSAGSAGGENFERWFAGVTQIHEIAGPGLGAARQRSVHPLWPSSFCVTDAQGQAFIHQDEGLSTMCVTDTAGALIERHRYEAFGEAFAFAADGVTPLASLRTEPTWRGMSALATTNIFETPNRLYDAELGVFTSRDPLLYADSSSPYAYAAHNPVDFADPSGAAKAPLGGSSEVRTGISKWLYEDSKGIPWYTPPREGDLFEESRPVDTGSIPGNYAINAWLGLSNVAKSAVNTPLEMLTDLDDLMMRSPVSVEWQAWRVMGPMMKTMGLTAKIPGGLRYLSYWVSTNRSWNLFAARGVFGLGVGSMGAGGGSLGSSSARQRRFMAEMLEVILADTEHPMRFLVDEATQNWVARSASSEEPTVQAGHLATNFMVKLGVGTERLAIEDAFLNQLTNWTGETGRRAWWSKEAAEVAGTFVEVESLKRWANEYPHLVPYLKLARSKGWTP
jgi:RHS repeat-associated protein